MNTKLPQAARLLTALSAASLFALSASGQTIVYEGFDIPPGELDGEMGATSFGWKETNFGVSPWNAWDQEANELYHGVVETGLTWPDLPTIGGSFEFMEETNDVNILTHRELPSAYYYSSSGHLWISGLFEASIDGDPSGGGHFQLILADAFNNAKQIYLGLAYNGETSVWSGGGERLYNNAEDRYKWGLSNEPVVEGETVFLVMHLNFDDKTGNFYVNPDASATDPGEPTFHFEQMLSDLYVDVVRLDIANAGPSAEGTGADYIGSHIDEIRVGETYASVAGGADTVDPVDPVDPEPATWGGYELAEGTGWVFTNDFYLGWIWVGEEADQDWVYVNSLETYVYLPEAHFDAAGSWAYAFDLDTWEVRDGYAPSLAVDALNTWVYAPGYSESMTASWVYVWNSTSVE